MADSALLSSDPYWIPHRIDLKRGRVEFLKLPPQAFSGASFLADYTPETAVDSATVSLDELVAMQPETGQLHFIFHTAFCRSTLLARTMNINGVSVGMSEPGIIASLANAGEAGTRFIKPCLMLLARARINADAAVQAVFVKPTNHANRLIPTLMHALPEAKAVLISNSLPDFVKAVNRKGLPGRRWARNLYLEVQSYAPLDLGIDSRENFLLSDLQVAGLAWLLQRRWFEANISGPSGARIRSLDSDRFNESRAESLRAIARFTGLNITRAQTESAASSPIFRTHAKLGGNYAAIRRKGDLQSASGVFDEEMDMVGKWIKQIELQAGLGEVWRKAILPEI
ncbi:hypothetical protein [Allopontixanthobacter sp.]|uniref:hypothetical protein n=1 Tax=Allopontixanthobacter sp. TaxID=2906452 RepID=UPI002AB9D47C|nr:hypothetical protein [Allopontixanthobacter sp.]MDZ4307566.1 hypothetical protein [Allopontixanthobacter sp.]